MNKRTPTYSLRALTTLLTVLSLAYPATPVQAGVFSSIFGDSNSIDCQPRDRECVLEATVALAIEDYRQREIRDDHYKYAVRAAQLAAMYPADQQAAMRGRWEDAGAGEDFFFRYDQDVAANAPPGTLTIDILRHALENQVSPDRRDYKQYVEWAFRTIMPREPEAGLALWKEYFPRMWDEAYGGVIAGFDWMANNNVDALEAYMSEYRMPKSQLYSPHQGLSRAAAAWCARGNNGSGARLLGLLDAEREGWPADRDMKAMDWSYIMEGLLGCRGEQTAIAFVDPVVAQMRADVAAKQTISDEQERRFIVDVIVSEVAQRVTQPLVLHLMRAGKRPEAEAVFQKLPMRATVMEGADVAKGPIGFQYPQMKFEEFIEQHKDDAADSAEPKQALSWFVDKFDPATEICCLEREHGAISNAGAIWPDPLARKAAAKALDVLRAKAEKDPGAQLAWLDRERLRLAAIERKTGLCELADSTLSEMLSHAPDYGSMDLRLEMLMDYIRYLDEKPAAEKTGDGSNCIVK